LIWISNRRCAAISLVSAAMMPDYTGKDISMEYDEE
jgi:hypothetical protein